MSPRSSYSAVFPGTVKDWLPSHLTEGPGLGQPTGRGHGLVRNGMPTRSLGPPCVTLPYPHPPHPELSRCCTASQGSWNPEGQGQHKEGVSHSGTVHLPNLPVPVRGFWLLTGRNTQVSFPGLNRIVLNSEQQVLT